MVPQHVISRSMYIFICLFSLVLVTWQGQAAVLSGNVTLADSLTASQLGAVQGEVTDVWGYQDPGDGKEYVLVSFKKQVANPNVGGTAIVDVSNPDNISRLPNLMLSGEALDVKTYIQTGTGDIYAYIANGSADDVKIFKITDPDDPQPVGAIPVDTTPECDDPNAFIKHAHNILVEDGVLYVATSDNTGRVECLGQTTPRMLYMFNLESDPDNPPVDRRMANSGYGSTTPVPRRARFMGGW